MHSKNNKRIAVYAVIAVVIFTVLNLKNLIYFFYPVKYNALILKYSQEYDLDPYLVSAIINVESRFRPYAESHRNAKGLMQITPSTGKWAAEKLHINNFEENMLFNPEINVMIGCWYLDYLRKEFGERRDECLNTLAAYNGGSGNVKRWLKDREFSQDGVTLSDIPFKETEQYVDKVLKNYRVYKWLYKVFHME